LNLLDRRSDLLLEVVCVHLHLLICDLETLQVFLSVGLLAVDIALDVCHVHLLLHLCRLFLHMQPVLILLRGEVEFPLVFVLDKLSVLLVSLKGVHCCSCNRLLVAYLLLSLILFSELLISLLDLEDLVGLVFDLHSRVLCGNFEVKLSIDDVVLVARESGWLFQ